MSIDILFFELLRVGTVSSILAAFLMGGGGRGMFGGGGIIRLIGRLTRWTLGRSKDLGGTGGIFTLLAGALTSSALVLVLAITEGVA